MPHERARRRLAASAAAALLALAACGREKAAAPPNEAAFTTRTLATSLLQRGQLPEAEAQFRKLVELLPDDAMAHASLGLTYLQEAKYAAAEPELLRARKLAPNDADAVLALARLYSVTARAADARAVLEPLGRATPPDQRALYALAQLDTAMADDAAAARYQRALDRLAAVAPANVVVRLDLADLYARRGQADSVLRQLEEVRRIPPSPPAEALPQLDSAIALLHEGKLAEARTPLGRFRSAMQVTSPYQASLEAIRPVDVALVGTPVLAYAPATLVANRGSDDGSGADTARFVDASDQAGLLDVERAGARGQAAPAPGAPRAIAVAVGDVRGDGHDDLLVSASSGGAAASSARLVALQGGFANDVTTRAGVAIPGGATFATFADLDNDGWLDVFAIGGDGRGHYLRNRGDGTFADATGASRLGDVGSARTALVADLDHDGDLDVLLLGPDGRRFYRNNLDGTFTDATAESGLGGPAAYDGAFGDLDDDGRLDVVTTGPGGLTLWHNGGAQRFADATSQRGLADARGATGAVAIGDYDNDGRLDLVALGLTGDGAGFWRNRGDGTFERDARANGALAALRGVRGTSLALVDYDNDGRLDVVVAGTQASGRGRGVVLLHNDGAGRFTDRSARLPAAPAQGTAVVAADVDQDGDQDLLVADTAGTVRLLRNDGGNARMSVRIRLRGLRTGSGKNNDYGIGARLELRAGDVYQTRVVSGPVTQFGLGKHLKADVLRIEWPNGVPQTVYFPGSDQDVVELESLKGSCAFAYTWDGTRFRFVTDAMWRSALGMPLGLMAGGAATAFAPAGASQEYVRIPGDALRPKDGRYVMQLTEELWETAYADELKLVAVDHPDSVDVFVDERFVPPGPVSLRLFQVAHAELPRTAVDGQGTDVLQALRANDDVYVSNLVPTRYQGVVEPHDLVLDLGDDAGRPGTYLFLRGWIYPTDASINVALSQQKAIALAPPSLEVRDARGRWQVADASLGFPSGKNKTMVIALAGKFPTRDHHVRLRTNMQIYWDQAFVAGDAAASPVKTTTLAPIAADLHARGFSRTFRKGGRYGPYWFDYADVTRGAPWRPIEGAFTRFGDVLPLLDRPDDRYIVMAPGDETTIQFDASSEAALPRGWKRDFLLYTDGWIKDSDLNTAFGTSVGPLPFHRIRSYPYAPGDSYPADAEHATYLREYETRVVGRR